MTAHGAANPLGDLVILASFLACWQGAGMSGRAARREIRRRAKREDEGR